MPTIRKILVVCVGNVCRSPMGAAMLRAAMPDKDISSAGINALEGAPADEMVVELMRQRGIDVARHRGRQLDETTLHESDLILVMEKGHQRWIESRWPQIRGRVYRWGHWSDFDVLDPFRQDAQAFREAAGLLERGLNDWRVKLCVF